MHGISLDFIKSMDRSSAGLEVTDKPNKSRPIIGVYFLVAIRGNWIVTKFLKFRGIRFDEEDVDFRRI